MLTSQKASQIALSYMKDFCFSPIEDLGVVKNKVSEILIDRTGNKPLIDYIFSSNNMPAIVGNIERQMPNAPQHIKDKLYSWQRTSDFWQDIHYWNFCLKMLLRYTS